jgi:Family of unknown function (DUF6982)
MACRQHEPRRRPLPGRQPAQGSHLRLPAGQGPLPRHAGGAGLRRKPVEVRVAALKALFFVRSLAGDRQQRSRENDLTAAGAVAGRRIRVAFKDGEVLVETTQGYDHSRPGFFVVPVDPKSNNVRCFVVAAATQEVGFL